MAIGWGVFGLANQRKKDFSNIEMLRWSERKDKALDCLPGKQTTHHDARSNARFLQRSLIGEDASVWR